MNEIDLEAVKRSVQEHVAIVPDSVLMMYLGAISAQLALRHDFDDPEHAIRDALEKGAFSVPAWGAKERRELDAFTKLTRGRYVGVQIGLVVSPSRAAGLN